MNLGFVLFCFVLFFSIFLLLLLITKKIYTNISFHQILHNTYNQCRLLYHKKNKIVFFHSNNRSKKILQVTLLLDYWSSNTIHYWKILPEMEYFPIRKNCRTAYCISNILWFWCEKQMIKERPGSNHTEFNTHLDAHANW